MNFEVMLLITNFQLSIINYTQKAEQSVNFYVLESGGGPYSWKFNIKYKNEKTSDMPVGKPEI